MPTIPIKESGNTFSHEDANVPFAIEAAVYDSPNNELDVTVGMGRYDFGGGVIFELTSSQIYSFSNPAASTTYYVYVDYAAGTPKVTIKTGSTASTGQIRIGSVALDGTKVVTTITDLRSFLPSGSNVVVGNGSATAPSIGFASHSSGLYMIGTTSVGLSYNGVGKLEYGNSAFQPLADAGMALGSSTRRFLSAYVRDYAYIWDANNVQHEVGKDATNPGVWIRALANPASGEALFGVQSSGGAERLVVHHDADALVVSPTGSICNRFRAGLGTNAAPSITFDADSDTGIYRFSTNAIGFTTGAGAHSYMVRSGSESRYHLGAETNDWLGYDVTNEYFRLVLNSAERFRVDNSGHVVLNTNSSIIAGNASVEFRRSGSTDFLELKSNDLVDIYVNSLVGRWDAGGLQVNVNGSRDAPAIHFNDPDVGFFHDAGLNRLCFTNDLAGNTAYFSTLIMSATQLVAGRDRVIDLGNTTFAFDDVRAVSFSPDSDLTIKDEVEDTPLGLDFVRALRARSFKFNDGNRVHEGFGVQEIVDAMRYVGVEDRAIWADPMVDAPDPEKWPEFYEDDGVTPKDGKGVLAYRPLEMIGPIVRAVQQLADRVDALDGTPTPKAPPPVKEVRKTPGDRRKIYEKKGIARGGPTSSAK